MWLRIMHYTFISFIKMHKGRLTTYNASRANKFSKAVSNKYK